MPVVTMETELAMIVVTDTTQHTTMKKPPLASFPIQHVWSQVHHNHESGYTTIM